MAEYGGRFVRGSRLDNTGAECVVSCVWRLVVGVLGLASCCVWRPGSLAAWQPSRADGAGTAGSAGVIVHDLDLGDLPLATIQYKHKYKYKYLAC